MTAHNGHRIEAFKVDVALICLGDGLDSEDATARGDAHAELAFEIVIYARFDEFRGETRGEIGENVAVVGRNRLISCIAGAQGAYEPRPDREAREPGKLLVGGDVL